MLDRTTTPYILWSSSDRGEPYRIRICLKMVDLPDSPAPSSSSLTLSSSCCLALSSSRSMPLDLASSAGSSAPGLLCRAASDFPCAGSGAEDPHPMVALCGADCAINQCGAALLCCCFAGGCASRCSKSLGLMLAVLLLPTVSRFFQRVVLAVVAASAAAVMYVRNRPTSDVCRRVLCFVCLHNRRRPMPLMSKTSTTRSNRGRCG
mmetsp:Transcript_817/g.1940  ORF Transcript_817/g.1940 Transcript_817/m.1940 type:complete len:206 (-) Transcript_817:22-639(-)